MPDYVSPNVFIFFRVIGATVLFWLIKLFLPREWIAPKDLLLVAFCGIFGIAVNQLFFFHGLNLSSSINSGIIMTLNPILVVIIAFVWSKTPILKHQLLGIGLGTTGALLLTLTGSSVSPKASLGDIFLFVNAFSYAIYLVIAKPLMQKYTPFTVITYVFTFGSFFVALYPPTLPELFHTRFEAIPAPVWVKIVYVVVGVTFLTYLLTMFGLKYLSAAVSSGYMYVQPVFVIIFAFLFAWLGITDDYTHTISWAKVGYMVLIFAGVWVLSRKK